MGLQLIKDGYGNNTGVFVPITDWEVIIQKHDDLKELVELASTAPKKLSHLAGTLSKKTAADMLKHVEDSRNEWEQRLEKQF